MKKIAALYASRNALAHVIKLVTTCSEFSNSMPDGNKGKT